jgi:hypothetical protein
MKSLNQHLEKLPGASPPIARRAWWLKAAWSTIRNEFGAGGFGEEAGAVAGDPVDFFDLWFAKFAVSSCCPA